MPLVAFAIGVLVTLAGVAVLVFPAVVLSLAQHSVTPLQLYAAAAIRIGVGLLFISVARESRLPGLIRVFGGVALLAGVATLFLGVGRGQAIADWVSHHGIGVLRSWAVVPLAIGVSILYACAPVRRAA